MRIKPYDHTRIIITYSFSWKTQTKTLPSYIPFPKKIETGFQVVTSRFPTSSCLLVVYIPIRFVPRSPLKNLMAMAQNIATFIHPAQIQKIPLFSGGFAGKSSNDIFSTHIPFLNCWVLRCFNLPAFWTSRCLPTATSSEHLWQSPAAAAAPPRGRWSSWPGSCGAAPPAHGLPGGWPPWCAGRSFQEAGKAWKSHSKP